MTLPFEKNNLRKYDCFVCGSSHTDFEAFKAHVKEKHQEGREYVICPLDRCGAPVRDLKTHMKAKHPFDPMPKATQMKAMIWKDQNPNGKPKTRKPTFREGYFVSIKMHGLEMHYRSGLEAETYELLEQISEVLEYHVEPLKTGIPYLFEGKEHKYFPDLSVKFVDRIEIWEVKPETQCTLPVNIAKWAAANAYCEARGWTFMVLNEKGMGRLRKMIKTNKILNEQKTTFKN